MVLFAAIRSLKKLFKLSPGTKPSVPQPRVQAPPSVPGLSLTDSRAVFACVSRHGLLLLGVRCPSCGEIVARPGEWDKVVATTWGEAVMCSPCEKVLLASPDTDVDPIVPGDQYDEELYHTFARPEGWVEPRQKTLKRAPVLGDWIVVVQKTLVEINSVLQDLNGGEGRIIALVDDGLARVALDGNTGVGGSGLGEQIATLPISSVRVMASNRIAPGDIIRILRGPHAGQAGTLLTAERGNCQVKIDGDPSPRTIKIPIERIERIEEP